MAVVNSVVLSKDWKVVRVGIEGAYPPFSSVTATGELVGFDVEISKALCRQFGAECTLVSQAWDGIIPGLLANKYDCIISSMAVTEERKKKVSFTNKYYQSVARYAAKKGSIPQFSPEILKGKTIGVQRATIHDRYLSDIYGTTVTIKRYGTQDEANLDLIAGRVDMVLADGIVLSEGFLKKNEGKEFEFVGPPLTDKKYFGTVAIACRKQDKDLIEKINNAIIAIRGNGVYKQVADKYFDFDIFGTGE